MNFTKTLTLLALLAVVALLVSQEFRFRRTLAELRAEHAAALATAEAAGGAGGGTAEETREAVRQMSRARAELAAAQQRLAAVTDQIRQTQGPMSRTELLGPRSSRPREITTAEATDYNPTLSSPTQPRRSWGEEQATGAPDTFQAGDIPTAWAPQQQDGGEEWLHLSYSNSVPLAEVRVRETHNPGAVSKVAAVLPNGQEVVIWEGVEEAGTAPVDKVFPVQGSIIASGVRVYLDTRRVPGWNEIDAVELVGRDGSRQWAAHASASSSYAGRR